MFKVGNRVRLKASKPNLAAKPGATATVIEPKGDYIRVAWDRNELSGNQMDGFYYHSDFDAFVLTDQELADKYREVRKEHLSVFTALRDRGYKVTSDGVSLYVSEGHVKISKVVTETISL